MNKANWLFVLGLVSLVALGIQHVIFVPFLNAQVLYGSVIGTVTDQSGAVVQKAHVVVTNRATGVQRETDADENGGIVPITAQRGNDRIVAAENVSYCEKAWNN